MKKLIYTAFVICGMLTASCSDLLNLESKTDVTNNYLFTTPEGLNTAVTGLYSLARELPGGADNNESNLYIVTMCDFNTDIAILRAGVSTSIGRLNHEFYSKYWGKTPRGTMSISSGNITMVLLEKQMKLL